MLIKKGVNEFYKQEKEINNFAVLNQRSYTQPHGVDILQQETIEHNTG